MKNIKQMSKLKARALIAHSTIMVITKSIIVNWYAPTKTVNENFEIISKWKISVTLFQLNLLVYGRI